MYFCSILYLGQSLTGILVCTNQNTENKNSGYYNGRVKENHTKCWMSGTSHYKKDTFWSLKQNDFWNEDTSLIMQDTNLYCNVSEVYELSWEC